MCIICAAIPATAAVGAKLNADQLRKDLAHPLPIPKITGLMIARFRLLRATWAP